MMTDRPILFSALLDGRKTQTRRLASSPLAMVQVGDRLWVRESFTPQTNCTDGVILLFEASRKRGGSEAKQLMAISDDDRFPIFTQKIRPSIHMPRWASRLTLVVTDVRRQTLCDITEEDAIAEGIQFIGVRHSTTSWPVYHWEAKSTVDDSFDMPQMAYVDLWDNLHGPRNGEDPEIVALTYTVHQVNIDRLGA